MIKKSISKPASLTVSPTEFIQLSQFERFEDGTYRALLRVGSGELACTGRRFYFDGLPAFVEQLQGAYKRLTGSAELRHRYEEEFVRIEFTTLGHVVVSGVLVDYGPCRQRFEFCFEADQSFCPPLIDVLQGVSSELDT